MRKLLNLVLIFFLIAAGGTTLKQVYNIRVLGEEPITAPITSTGEPEPTVTEEPTATPTPTNPPSNNNSSSNSSGSNNNGGNGSSTSAPVCTTGKPNGTPKITSIKRTGAKQLTITWTPVTGNNTYYLIAYGNKTGVYTYATPEIAGSNTTSVSLNELAVGGVYFMRIRAGNGCMPGDYSPESVGKVSGRMNVPQKITTKVTVTGKVIGVKQKTPVVDEVATSTPTPSRVQSKSSQPTVMQKVTLFFKDLFKL